MNSTSQVQLHSNMNTHSNMNSLLSQLIVQLYNYIQTIQNDTYMYVDMQSGNSFNT